MCWDISLHSNIKLTIEAFPNIRDKRVLKVTEPLEQVPAFLFPDFPIIYRKDNETILSEMEWGVNPVYIHDPKERDIRRRSMVNARCERILDDKHSYWYKLRNNRCLIPVSGTYEHRKIKGWTKKVPYYIWLAGREMIYIPGLFQVLEFADQDGVVHYNQSFTLITRTANEVMKGIHNDGENKHRMPLFISPEMEHAWLDDELKQEDMREIFNYEMPVDSMGYQPVYTIRGTERPDGKHKYDIWDWPGLPPLGNDSPLKSQTSLFD